MESSPLLVGVYAHDLAAADAPLPCDHDRLHVVGGAEQYELLGQVGLGDWGREPAVDDLQVRRPSGCEPTYSLQGQCRATTGSGHC